MASSANLPPWLTHSQRRHGRPAGAQRAVTVFDKALARARKRMSAYARPRAHPCMYGYVLLRTRAARHDPPSLHGRPPTRRSRDLDGANRRQPPRDTYRSEITVRWTRPPPSRGAWRWCTGFFTMMMDDGRRTDILHRLPERAPTPKPCGTRLLRCSTVGAPPPQWKRLVHAAAGARRSGRLCKLGKDSKMRRETRDIAAESFENRASAIPS